MLDRIDIAAASSYLHRVMNRCAEAAFESNPMLDDLDAPDGVGLMLRADGETGKLLDGSLTFDPPVPASDIGAVIERVVTLRDDSIRGLLHAPDDHDWSSVGPTRVTLALPPRPDASAPISVARIVFPDQYTSPTGLVIGMVLEDSRVEPIDLVAHTPEGGPIRALAAVAGEPQPATGEHWSGLLWCDDAARLFGGWNHLGMWFGMPPTFVPIASVGVDGMTWGFVWDHPDRPIDDGLLYQISPGGRFVLEDARATKRYLLAELNDRRGRTDDTALLDTWIAALDDVAEETDRERNAAIDGEISRLGVIDRQGGERWISTTNGDAISVPADSFDTGAIDVYGTALELLAHARTQLDAGFTGSAYSSAYRCLVTGTHGRRAFDIHASYAAMIEPLRALGRSFFADRCAAIISEAAPMCHTVPGME